MFRSVSGIIFDFDGTLVDSLHLWREIDEEFLRERGHACPDDLQRQIEGMGLFDCALYFRKRFGLRESAQDLIDIWSGMAHKKYFSLPWKEGSEAFITAAAARKYPMAMATSSDYGLVEKILAHRGIREHFGGIATSDRVGASKPAPDVFLEAARQIGVPPSECVVFEDTLSGIEGAKAAGMKTVAVFDEHTANWEQIRSASDFHIYHYQSALCELRGNHE